MPTTARRSYRFGKYCLDVRDRLLSKDDAALPIPPKVFDTLLLLVEEAGHVVPKEEMLERLWPDTFVEDGTLTQYISLLRKALGEDGKWVENVPRRGYRFVAPVELVDEPEGVTLPRTPSATSRRRLLWPGVAVAVALIVAAAAWLAWTRWSASPAIRSVAVLPFLNLSGDRSLDYIGDGIADELTHALGRIPGLEVSARTSAWQFRGKNEDVRNIGQRLNVASVLEGSVRVQEDRVRVAARLVDTRTGRRVWSDTFEGSADDLLHVYEQIGSATARSLASTFRQPQYASHKPTGPAYRSYLQGRYFLAKGRPETFRKALDSFRDAIAKDAQFARAYAGLSDTYYRWALWENLPPAEALNEARGAAEHALKLDEQLPEAHASLANVHFLLDWNWAEAERRFRRSVELDSGRADTWHWFSHLLTAQGRHKESEQAARRAAELEPFDLPAQNHLGWCYYFAGDHDLAIQQHRKVLEMDPAHGQTRLLLGRALLQQKQYTQATDQLRRNLELSPDSPVRISALAQAYALSGERVEAMRLLERLLALRSKQYVSAYLIALIHAAVGTNKEALDYLEQAAAERATGIVEMKYEPVLRPLSHEARFLNLLKRMGL